MNELVGLVKIRFGRELSNGMICFIQKIERERDRESFWESIYKITANREFRVQLLKLINYYCQRKITHVRDYLLDDKFNQTRKQNKQREQTQSIT